MFPPRWSRYQAQWLAVVGVIAFALSSAAIGSSRAASFLFDATHLETAGNADWVIDEDSSPQRFPTPDQATVNSSTGETFWKGAISAWGIELVKRGHQVETLPSGTAITYGNNSNVQDLSHYQVFVVDEPNKLFTATEKTAIVNFVKNGGSLFMVADHGGSDRDGNGKDSVDAWNDLFANNTVQKAPFGIVFNGDKISPAHESADSSPSSPITHGPAGTITQFIFSDGSSITIDPTKNATIKGAVWTTSSHNNTNVMVAYGTFGGGKFVAIGDSSPIDDGTGASGNTLFDGWDDGGGDDGQLVINASIWLATTSGSAPPANDNFAAAATITGTTASASGTNVNATKEVSEPNHAGNAGGKSVWWNWTAPSAGTVVIDTTGSSFDTLLGVYTGTAVSGLTQIGANDNDGANLTSRVTFTATAGVIYRIAVDGNNGASGNIQLNLALTIPPPPGMVTIASWNFDTTPYSTPLAASSGSGNIDYSAWTGMVTNFSGQPSTGQALALVDGNNSYIEIDISMAGYSGLTLSFDTRGTGTAYNSGLWSWSVNGGGFTTLPGVNTASTSSTWSTRTVDFSGQTALNNAANVRLRYTLSGATGTQQNNRIDNLALMATEVPVVSTVVNDPDAYEHGPQGSTITVSSSLSAPAGGLAVHYQLGGTATTPGNSGADYSISGNSAAGVVTIPAGATSAFLTFTPLPDNDPAEFDETIAFTLQTGTGYFVGSANSGTITIHDDTPYSAAWATQFPTFKGAAADPQLDIENDGIKNLLEFAFNGDPIHSDLSILPTIGQMQFADPNDGNALKPYPVITFRRRTDAPDLNYAVAISNDLVMWTNNVEEVSVTPTADPNVEEVVYRGLEPISGNGSVSPVFLQVIVSSGGE